ncbi:hypothetical protein PFFCH_00591 [Plasmodium falciparum FCH/4]|uniref:Cation-transporting P-type ATPase C-terminal domain-containing protein n=1 Tax=Plasmodium falciparum FCH/4 TaxID=1036724 RepID=A0A024VT89_PLAFA|nr:hypothetical protein PFFCH_00591 [Plasmodium falciparum FCH/4]
MDQRNIQNDYDEKNGDDNHTYNTSFDISNVHNNYHNNNNNNNNHVDYVNYDYNNHAYENRNTQNKYFNESNSSMNSITSLLYNSKLMWTNKVTLNNTPSNYHLLIYALAGCSCVYYDNNNIYGNEIDKRLCEATEMKITNYINDDNVNIKKISLKINNNTYKSFDVLKTYEFDYYTKISTTLTYGNFDFKEKKYIVFSKGSFDKIYMKCIKNEELYFFKKKEQEYSKNGFYVIALAFKIISNMKYEHILDLPRQLLEKDMNFLSLIMFNNHIKKDASMVIQTLKGSSIRPVILTGDNAYNCLYVGNKIGLFNNVNFYESFFSLNMNSNINNKYINNNKKNNIYLNELNTNNHLSNTKNINSSIHSNMSNMELNHDEMKHSPKSPASKFLSFENFFKSGKKKNIKNNNKTDNENNYEDDNVMHNQSDYQYDHLLTPGTEHLDGFKNNETQKKEKHIYESLDKSQKLNETSKYIPGNAANYTTYSEFNHKYDQHKYDMNNEFSNDENSALIPHHVKEKNKRNKKKRSHIINTLINDNISDDENNSVYSQSHIFFNEQKLSISIINEEEEQKSDENIIVYGYLLNDELIFVNVHNEKRINKNVVLFKDIYKEIILTGEAYTFIRYHVFQIKTPDEDFDSEELEEYKNFLLRIRIFSRLTPNNKIEVIRDFIKFDYISGMCGDGSNDCGALKISHAGLALSNLDTSVVSPFSSKNENLKSVIDILREGRACLVTSINCYKYMLLYGFMISFIKILLFMNAHAVMSEYGYLFFDNVILLLLAKSMTLSKPACKLKTQTPTSSIIGAQTILSLLCTLLVNFFFLYSIIFYFLPINNLPSSYQANSSAPKSSWWLMSDNYESFLACIWFCFQIVNSALILTFGGKYRKPIFTNHTFMAYYVLINSFLFYLIVGGPNRLTCLFRMNCNDEISKITKFKFLELISYSASGLSFYGPHGHNILSTGLKIKFLLLNFINIAVNIFISKYILCESLYNVVRRFFNFQNRKVPI